MDAIGINIGYIALQVLFCSFPLLYLIPLVLVAVDLRKHADLDTQTMLLWILIVVVAPLLGPLAYLVFGRNNT